MTWYIPWSVSLCSWYAKWKLLPQKAQLRMLILWCTFRKALPLHILSLSYNGSVKMGSGYSKVSYSVKFFLLSYFNINNNNNLNKDDFHICWYMSAKLHSITYFMKVSLVFNFGFISFFLCCLQARVGYM
jgi:hypothetical protein